MHFRILAVTFGLILCPREEPGVEYWVDMVPERMDHDEGSLSEVRKPHRETPFPDTVPQKYPQAAAPGDLQVTREGPGETTASSNTPHAFPVSEHLPGQAQNKHSGSKDSGKSRIIAEPDANPPRQFEVQPGTHHRETSLAVRTEEPGPESEPVPRGGEHSKPDRVTQHRGAKENREEPLQASRASADPRRPLAPGPGPPQQRDVWEEDYCCCLCNVLSAVSVLHFLWKYSDRDSFKRRAEGWPQPNTSSPGERLSAGRAPLPDSSTLHLFHGRFVKASQATLCRTEAFLEGLTLDLLEVMRSTSAERAGVIMEDFIQAARGSDIVVPIVPPEPYAFQSQLWCTSEDRMQGCGKINIVKKMESQNGCHCETSEDVVCLLHPQVEKHTRKCSSDVVSLLCRDNTSFLCKDKVTKWFKGSIRKAWEQISHKYDFELSTSEIDIPGGLVVRFRSGRKVHFTLNPVVNIHNTIAYFSTTPCSNISDISWTVSLTNYEDIFLKNVCKTLPENACHSQVLDIISFLHQKQTALTGSSALKDFHFKNALMEVLLSTQPSQWHPEDLHCRLRDLVVLMEKSLCQRMLRHALIGNPLAQHVELPPQLSQAQRVNLFYPLVVEDCIYNTMKHFQEILRNANILIKDYTFSEPS